MAASLHALASATLLLLLVLVPHACTAASNKTALQDGCESYAAGDQSSYDYCVWTLQRADKEGAATAADALGLAAIAARFARATARATRAKIAGLLANETLPPARRGSLAACAREYAAAVHWLGHAATAARYGNTRRAQTLLEDATGTPDRCGAAFAAARQDSPLADRDLGLDDQIELAIALLAPPWPSPPVS